MRWFLMLQVGAQAGGLGKAPAFRFILTAAHFHEKIEKGLWLLEGEARV